MSKSRPPYPEEFRKEAVELVRSGRSITDVAGSLGVSHQALRNWVKRWSVPKAVESAFTQQACPRHGARLSP